MKEPNLILGEGNITELKVDNGDFQCMINGVKFSGTYSTDIQDVHEYYCIIESMGPYDDNKLDDVLWRSYDIISELIENLPDFQDDAWEKHLDCGDYYIER